MACILMIDDDYIFRATLQDMLEGAGYHMLEARDGREGLAALQAHPIFLVITDILMLEQESFETLQQLRTLTPSPRSSRSREGARRGDWSCHRSPREAAPIGRCGSRCAPTISTQPCRRSSRGHKRIQCLTGQGHLATAPGICPYAVFSPLQRAYGPIRGQ